MKTDIKLALRLALNELAIAPPTDASGNEVIHVERTKQSQHGDFASNIALQLAPRFKQNPRQLAAKIVAELPTQDLFAKCEIAGPGFINFFLTKQALYTTITRIRELKAAYGHSDIGKAKKVLVEFVSANPTGPLHVGHGRGAAYGDALARVLKATGFAVCSEYYLNDAGRQMDILAASVWLRYLELCGRKLLFPDGAYQGDYIFDIAATVHRRHGDKFECDSPVLLKDLPEQAEQKLDALITKAKKFLGLKHYEIIFGIALDSLVDNIKSDLQHFRVEFDNWFSERSLLTDHSIDKAITILDKRQLLYRRDDALWFKSTEFNDEKDRVVKRANGSYTYFASDIAYCLNKKERGFEELIHVWGADHHGYVARLKGAFTALGHNPNDLTVLLVQFANLYRGKQKISMSTRGGEFVTLKQLRQEVGCDAARFFYALRTPDQHLDFDLELAKSQSNDNPVYYVQYAHARVCSVFRQLAEKGIDYELDNEKNYALLSEPQELELIQELSRYPEVVESAAQNFAPHQIAYFLRELANKFHTYYNAHPFIAAESNLRNARLALIDASKQVIANGLGLLGVSAPEKM